MSHIPTGTWTIDPVHTEVGFTVRHLMSKVRGHFTDFEGTIVTADPVTDSTVNVEARLASIDTRNPQRDAHLRSSDFFDVEANPTMTFQSRSVRESGEVLEVTGDLTIKGVTRPVQLHVEPLGTGKDAYGGTRLGVEASGQISRRDFGIDFNIPLEGDKLMIGDTITLVIAAQAVLEQGASMAA